MKIFTVSNDNLKRGDTLVPAYYYYLLILKERIKKKGIKYVDIGEFDISDGEHAAIPRTYNKGIRYLYGRNIREGMIDFDPISDVPYIDQEDYDLITRTHISQDDVLVPIVGTIGKSAVYKKEYVGIAGIPRHIARITVPKSAPITPEYLSVFFRTVYGKMQLYSFSTGNIQPLLSLQNLSSVSIPIINHSLIEKITTLEEHANNCLIEGNKCIEEAKHLFYKGLNFDITSIKGDFSFTVTSGDLNINNVWNPENYNKKYEKIVTEIEKNNGYTTLGELLDASFHGEEVGSDNYNDYIHKNENDYAFIRTSDIANHQIDLFPDFFVPTEVKGELKQVIYKNDVIFTKDGKIGAVAMVTENDNCILSSGIQILRVNKEAIAKGITQEYLFVALSIKEVGYYAAKRRTVVASTIPHLRPEKLKEIEIPLMDKKIVNKITSLVKKGFEFYNERKPILKESLSILEKELNDLNNN